MATTRTVYLDQNKWIDVSRIIHGRSDDPGLRAVVEFMTVARDQRLQSYPLSLAHYIETSKRADMDQRRRLASVLLSFSKGLTIASPAAVVRWELDKAIRRVFDCSCEPRPFSMFGDGIRHLVERTDLELKLRTDGLDAEDAALLRELAEHAFELSVLLGRDSIGEPRLDFRKQGATFSDTIARLRQLWAAAPRGASSDIAFLSFSLGDCSPAVEEAVKHCAGSAKVPDWSQPATIDWPKWMQLMETLKSRRLDAHLMFQFASNMQIKMRPSDLNDVAYLGIAACYCDVLVCEKQMADMLTRAPEGLVKAKVITDIRDLPAC